MIDLKLPKINADRLEDRVSQMQSFLYQHVEELDYALSQIQKDQDTTTEAINEVKNDDTGIDMVMSKVNKLGRTTTELKADADGIKTSVETVGERVDTVTNDLGELEAEVRVNYATKSELEQTSDEIMLKVTDELDGAVTTYELEYEPTLDNFPAWDFTYNLVCGEEGDAGYFECDDGTVFEYTNDSYRKHARDVAFDTTSNQTYRFRREGEEWKWMPVADTDFGVAMKRIAELQVKAGEIDADVSEQTKLITAQGQSIQTNTASIKELPKSISMNVTESKDGSTPKKATIELTMTDGNGKATIIAKDISFDGLVSFMNSVGKGAKDYSDAELKNKVLKENTTYIDGGKIYTNSIGANQIDTAQLVVGDNIKLKSGAIIEWDSVKHPANLATQDQLPKASQLWSTEVGQTWLRTNTVEARDLNITGGKMDIKKPYDDSWPIYIHLQEYHNSTDQIGLADTSIGAGWARLTGIGSLSTVEIAESEGVFYINYNGQKADAVQIDSGNYVYFDKTPLVGSESLLKESDTAWVAPSNWSAVSYGNSISFNVRGYKTLVLEGYVNGTAPYQMLTIPIAMLTTSDKRYAISYGSTYYYATMKVVNGTLTLSSSGSPTGVWSKAYLQR